MFEVDLTALRSKVNKHPGDWKSVTLLEEWVGENSLQCDSDMFKAWRTIIDFRNASFPYHETDDRVIELTAFFRRKYPPECPELWIDVLTRFLKSIESFRDLLSRTLKGSP